MDEHEHPHVATVGSYVVIFLILVALTVLTVFTALSPLGHWHAPVALGIAVVKATLVFLFFMHLLHSPKVTWLVAGGTFVWLGIMFALTLADYWSRGIVGRYQ
jgi:cytochrome c oxidase subunit 4